MYKGIILSLTAAILVEPVLASELNCDPFGASQRASSCRLAACSQGKTADVRHLNYTGPG